MLRPSRRQFFATSSSLIAGAALGTSRAATASVCTLPTRSRKPIDTFLPDIVDPDTLRALASAAIEAAKDAGATYADIRVADVRRLRVDWSMPELMPLPRNDMWLEYHYGLRVRVGSAWSFEFGSDPSLDEVRRAARAATITARGLARVTPDAAAMLPAPAVRSEWATPLTIDPFRVSPDEYAMLLGAFIDAAQRVRYGTVQELTLNWVTETRVFASSEGSLLTQRLTRGNPTVVVHAGTPLRHGGVALPVADIIPGGIGFEYVLRPGIQDRIKETTEEAAKLIHYPEGDAEVGRFPAVFDGATTGAVIATTIARALEGSRVLGENMDDAGGSFLSPIESTLGQPIFSPRLTIEADTPFPHHNAPRWDDEGMPMESFTVVDQGRPVDYFMTRSTVPMLAGWYAKMKRPLRTHGTCIAWGASDVPDACASQLTVHTGSSGTTLGTLVKELGTGLLIYGVGGEETPAGVMTNPQVSGGIFSPRMLFEVKNGQIVRRLRGGIVQFSVKTLAKQIVSLGDSSSVQCHVYQNWQGFNGAPRTTPVLAPAAHLTSLDVMQMKGALG